MHERNDLPTGYLPTGGEAAGDDLEQHDFQLAGLALATLVLLVAHAGIIRDPRHALAAAGGGIGRHVDVVQRFMYPASDGRCRVQLCS